LFALCDASLISNEERKVGESAENTTEFVNNDFSKQREEL
jgi:hypothetical protein